MRTAAVARASPTDTRRAAPKMVKGGSASAKRDPERTRAAILQSAVAEFARYGLGGARVDRIAERARANKRMLYHYFGDKDALFLAVLEDRYAHIRSAE